MDDVPLIEGDQMRYLKVGSKLTEGLRRRLIDFLRSSSDCFAWSHADMPGIYPEIIMHKLQVDPLHQHVRQKRRKFAPERDAIINDEVKSLLDGGFVREVQYPEWLANVVVVKKKNENLEALRQVSRLFRNPPDLPLRITLKCSGLLFSDYQSSRTHHL